MKIEIEGSVKEITDFVIEVRSRLYMNTVIENKKPKPGEGYRCPPGEKGTPGYL